MPLISFSLFFCQVQFREGVSVAKSDGFHAPNGVVAHVQDPQLGTDAPQTFFVEGLDHVVVEFQLFEIRQGPEVFHVLDAMRSQRQRSQFVHVGEFRIHKVGSQSGNLLSRRPHEANVRVGGRPVLDLAGVPRRQFVVVAMIVIVIVVVAMIVIVIVVALLQLGPIDNRLNGIRIGTGSIRIRHNNRRRCRCLGGSSSSCCSCRSSSSSSWWWW